MSLSKVDTPILCCQAWHALWKALIMMKLYRILEFLCFSWDKMFRFWRASLWRRWWRIRQDFRKKTLSRFDRCGRTMKVMKERCVGIDRKEVYLPMCTDVHWVCFIIKANGNGIITNGVSIAWDDSLSQPPTTQQYFLNELLHFSNARFPSARFSVSERNDYREVVCWENQKFVWSSGLYVLAVLQQLGYSHYLPDIKVKNYN